MKNTALLIVFICYLIPINAYATINKTIQSAPSSTENLWLYSETTTSSITASYVPTNADLGTLEGVGPLGYVLGTENAPTVPSIDYFGYLNYNGYSLHLFSTYIMSTTDQTLTLLFNGDDGHSLWADGSFVGGAGFNTVVVSTLSLYANTPVKLDFVGANAGGPWAFWIGYSTNGGQSHAGPIEEAPGILMDAGGFTTQYSCNGFDSPLANGPVTVRKNRALPFKGVLVDSDGYHVTGLDILAPPVVQVDYYSVDSATAIDVSDEAISTGNATEGNQFFINEAGEWQYNLVTKNYTSPGTYVVKMLSGDAAEYMISGTCEGTFVIE